MTNSISKAPATPYQIDNPEEYARNILRLFLEGGRAMSNLMARSDAKSSPYSAASDMSEAAETINDINCLWMKDPGKLVEAQGSWWPHWTEWLAKYSGGWTTPREPGARLGVIEDAPGSYVKNKG